MQTTGNTILITGGSSGIGLALAKDFLRLGNTIIVVGRDVAKLNLIKKENPALITFQCDISVKKSLLELTSFIKQNYSGLNILINNAAVQYNYSFVDNETPIENIDYEIETNFSAPIKLTTLLLPILLQKKESAVVNVSSGLMISPKKSASVYCATKAAIHSFTKTLRYQLEGTPTKVFEIIPPLVETPMTSGGENKKVSAELLSHEFIQNFKANKYDSYIGKSKLLRFIHRISPKLSDKIMKNGI